MSHTGSDSVPVSGEPSSVVLIGTRANTPFSVVFHDGMPQSAQQRTRIAHGVHAYAVWPAVNPYFHSAGDIGRAPDSRSDFRRNRCFGCQTYRRNSAVQMTDPTPAMTSVMRWKDAVADAMNW